MSAAGVETAVLAGPDLRAGTPPPRADAIVRLSGTCGGRPSTLLLSAQDLSRHVLFLGSSGTGKTNCLLEVARQLKGQMGPCDGMIVFDPKGDFQCLRGGRDEALSVRGSTEFWNIFAEVTATSWDAEDVREDATEVFATVFSEACEKSPNVFFPKAACHLAADTVAAIAMRARDWPGGKIGAYLNNARLRAFLEGAGVVEFTKLLAGVPGCAASLKYLGGGGSDQALGVLAELQEAVRALFMGEFGGEGGFSARDFVRRREGRALFVNYDLGHASSSAYEVVVDLCLKEALAAPRPGGSLYVVIDELKMLPRLQHLSNALSFGRSCGVKVIAAAQNVEQLYEVYGEVGGRVMAAGFQTLVGFGSNAEASRRYVGGVAGERLVEVSYLGADGARRSDLQRAPAVEDWQLVSLGIGQAVVAMAGRSLFQFAFDRY